MGKFKAGKEEAAKMLAGLGMQQAEKLLEEIAKQDASLAEELRKGMVTLEDLIHLTPSMIAELLREIQLDKLGLAFRMASKELIEHITSHVSSGMKQEILDVATGPPRMASEIQEATEQIMEVVRKKVEKGELIINPHGDELV